MYGTYKLNDGTYKITRPGTNKTEYHGNGKDAWYSTKETINGHTVEYRSIRHSYRWHKCQVWFDGRQLRCRADYERAERLLNTPQ